MFSVVIPVYNHEKFVRQAILSALRSPLVEEILALDDGSKDKSASIVAQMAATNPGRVRDLTPPSGGNQGAHNRLNELVERARCEWVAVLNSDDAFVSGRFEHLIRDPGFAGCEFAFGNVLFMDERGVLIGAKRGPADTWSPFRSAGDLLKLAANGEFMELLRQQNYLITTSNMVFQKRLHAQVGGFRSYRYVHDWDFALRATQLGRAIHVPRYLTAYRVHGANTIQESESKAFAETKRMLDEWFPQNR